MAKPIHFSKILTALLLTLNCVILCICAMNMFNDALRNFGEETSPLVIEDSVFGNHEQFSVNTDVDGNVSCTIRDSPLAGVACKRIVAVPRLNELRLDNCELNSEQFQTLTRLKLKSIMISECDVPKRFLKILGKLKTLRHLYFSECFFEPDGLEALKSSPVVCLHLRECRKNNTSTCFDFADFRQIADLDKLGRLDLIRMCFDNTALAALKGGRNNIRFIDCEHCYLDDESLEIMQSLPELQFVRLLGNQHLSPGAVTALSKRAGIIKISSDIPRSAHRFIDESKFQEALPIELTKKFVD